MAYHSAATYNPDGLPSGSALRPLASSADELPPELRRQTVLTEGDAQMPPQPPAVHTREVEFVLGRNTRRLYAINNR